ncbi:MAG: hypothetical protein A2428_03145 [Bdellovibrionales bacterium RIFOXYC1_FULL_54_43]|nr:MAG: hypothetical protein A2428_03145 [Bdellovibrionales bacterium RIFOXYC1_FULL_54_43]OFZ82677.1 MAG: hypothetical protein A2603_02580 [Bdellovibrionales bacterium RIFOXYD1_FULL_55_31]
MSTNRLKLRIDGQPMDVSWFNSIKEAISGALVPRHFETSLPTAEAANLGSPTWRWKRIYRRAGGLYAGCIKAKYDYAGAVLIEQGWMRCDGRIVSQANYDAEHGAGSWAAYIGTSPLQGKYLPNFATTYIGHKPGAKPTGDVPFVPTGSNMFDFEHAHPQTTSDTPNPNMGKNLAMYEARNTPPDHQHTMNWTNALVGEKVISPEALAVKIFMRII